MDNILHISRTMDVGGAEKIVYQLATDLKEDFQEVHVASTGGLWEPKLEEKGVKHHPLKDIEKKDFKTIVSNFRNLQKLIKTENITIIHTHHRMAAFYARILTIFNKKVRHIYTAHGIFEDKVSFYRFAVKNASVIAVGESVKNKLIEMGVVRQARVIVNAIQSDQTTDSDPEITKNMGLKIGFIGRLEKGKGLSYLLEALAGLDNKDITLYIAGTGSLLDELENESTALKLSDKVKFLGYRDDTDTIINSCDVMVLPSLFEGLPLTLIEYMSYGKPVIASNIPGINDILNNENGTLFESGNSDSLRQAISNFIDNPESYQKKAMKSKEDYHAKFSYSIFLNGYRQVYRQE